MKKEMKKEMRLIDANELEVKMGDLCDEFGTDHLFIDAIVYEIGNAPTVDAVEVVHGCWEKEHDDLVIDRGWKCSHCNGSVYEMTYESYQYCPHCGAKMDGGNEQ